MKKTELRFPFWQLLLPALLAIIIYGQGLMFSWYQIVFLGFITIVLTTYSIFTKAQYKQRYIFNVVVFLLVFCIVSVKYHIDENQSAYNFSASETCYAGIVRDIPQEKAKTFACNIILKHPRNKLIVAYIQKDSASMALLPGQEIYFNARVQPFKNRGNLNDFDYERFMKNKGFSGSAYLSGSSWIASGREMHSFYTLAQSFRMKALNFYRSLHLDNDAYAFITALTLGYKYDISEKMQNAFRASGTSHVLAVSGLHVGIIYAIFAGLFSFAKRKGKRPVLQQMLIVGALWCYAFLTGLSPSVVRAVIMLTVACVGIIVNRRAFTWNTVAIAAFFILVFRPHSFYDIGFQMSFGAVIAILFFKPKMDKWYHPKTRFGSYIWTLTTVSVAAQLGVFPLGLYYFGTFPLYFFIANLVVVPLIGLIMYAGLPLLFFSLLNSIAGGAFLDSVQYLLSKVVKIMVNILLESVFRIEALPLSQINNLYLNLMSTIALIGCMVFITLHFEFKKPTLLIAALCSAVIFLAGIFMHSQLNTTSMFVVYKSPVIGQADIMKEQRGYNIYISEDGFISNTNTHIVQIPSIKQLSATTENTIQIKKQV